MAENILGYEKIPKLVAKFAAPSIVAMLVSSLYNIVDQIFIGQGVGYLGNAATNVAFPFTTICLAMALLLAVGGAAGFSLKLGEGDKKSAALFAGNAVSLTVIFGILYLAVIFAFLEPMLKAFGATETIMPYAKEYVAITGIGMPVLMLINVTSGLARADGSPKYSMICTMVGAVINTVLDYLFVMVYRWGMAGAAWATVIGQIASMLMGVAYLFRFKSVPLKLVDFIPKFKFCGRIMALGLSNSLNQVSITIVQVVLNNSLTHYGALSKYGADIPLAASGIVMKANSIMVSIFVGMSQGSQPIFGFNYGAGKYDRVRKAYLCASGATVAISTLGFIAFQTIPRQIISLFGTGNELYFEFAVKFMKTFLLMIAVNGVQTISSNFFAATGKPIKGAFLSLTRQVLFLVPLLIVMPIFFGVEGIMYTAPISDTLAFALSMFMVFSEFGKMKKLEKQREK